MAFLPLWLRQYQRRDLSDDALAGTITAILLVPQALAYALLAGLPPEVGLYASIIPPIIYALTGSSRTLAVGPVAVAAVMVAAALANFAQGDPALALAGALWLSFLSGVFLLLFAALRLGWLSHFVSHPVLNGFSTGAAITIIGTQLPTLLGISISSQHAFIGAINALLPELSKTQQLTLVSGATVILLLLISRHWLASWLKDLGMSASSAGLTTRVTPLLIVVLAILLSMRFDGGAHLAVVGDIPAGLPMPSLAFLWVPGWQSLVSSALLIALIAYVESLSVAKLLAMRRRQRIDANQELMALGSTNIASSIVGGMPVAGGFARSMVNFEAGAKTQLASIITASWVALAALVFSSGLAPLPKTVLAAIVVVAVTQLIDLRSILTTWRYDKRDGLSQVATVIGVLLLGIEPGLMIGIGLALVLYLHRTSNPHIAVIGQLAGTEHFRNVLRYSVQTWPSLLIVRIDENLYFANTPQVESQLLSLVADHPKAKHLVLVLSGVAAIDASGLELLESLHVSLSEAGIQLHLAEVKGPVMDRLQSTHFMHTLNPSHIYLSTHQAVSHLIQSSSEATL
ncbi:MAG: sulfate permease [Moraxellaceae bacterium]|nr:sulfate permease [Moraxellaceae bacterium]MDZ4385893.1 sulfate permease [Moraxellaceae bacterium]